MHNLSFRIAAASASLLLSLPSQTGNELIFVGSSTSGSTDQHALVESATGSILAESPSPFTDNVTGAVWANSGRKLYVGQSLMSRIAVADWDGTTATWSTLYQATGACYGVQFDSTRNRLWTLTGSSGSSRELVCLDADINSPSYGTYLTQTNSLSGATLERWCLSSSGNLACVPKAIINGNAFTLVDLNPSSANYLNIITSTNIPGTFSAGFSFTMSCKISLDDAYVYVLWAGIGTSSGLAVWDIAAQAWLDFDVMIGHQDLPLTLGAPNRMDLSLDRTFAVVSGQGGSGWAGRIDFDYANPSNSTFTQWSTLTAPNCDGISLSPDSSRVAMTSTATFLSTPSKLIIADASSGIQLQSTTLNTMWNVYFTAWQDASPIADYTPFGSGCTGSIGTPTLTAAPGSRPAIGSTFDADVSNLPLGAALMATGLSNTFTSGGLPLPLSLSILGMTGCTQYVDALVLDYFTGSTTATWSWSIPNTPILFGARFYNQAFSLDPGANSFGFAASNAATGKIGF